MESLTNIKTSIFTVVAVVGSTITSLIGGWDAALQTLLIFMAIDYFSGLVVAAVFKNSKKSESGAAESRAGFKGIIKKIMTLLFVLMGAQLELLLNVDYIRYGLIVAFIVNEGVSIFENGGLMGIPYPDVLSNALDILKKQNSEQNEVKE